MGHLIKGQTPREYRPSTGRRNSGLKTINERNNVDAVRRWNKLRQAVKARSQIQRNIRVKGFATRGRFTVRNATPKKKSPSVSMWRNTTPGVYFVSHPYQRGRFKVENILGFVPFPPSKKKSPKR